MDPELKQYLDEMKQSIDAKLDKLDAKIDKNTRDLSLLITEVKESLEREIQSVGTETKLLGMRFDRLEGRQSSMEFALNGIQRFLDGYGQNLSTALGTQTAQQRFLNDLAARVKKLEDERGKKEW